MSTLALVIWPFVVVYLFQRLTRPKAALFSFMIALLFLPERAIFKLPWVPVLDKATITNIVLALMLVVHGGRARAERWVPLLYVLLAVSAFGTWYTNREPLMYGPTLLAPLTVKDTMFVFITDCVGGILALYLGMRFFKDEQDLLLWARTLAFAGVGYCLFLLLELRVSPQLHRWVYGYHAHDDFLQAMRWGGYRPVGFMSHGLATSLFMLGTTISCLALVRRGGVRVWKLTSKQAAWLLSFMTLACKSSAVWVYFTFAMPLARWGKAKTMWRVALVLAAVTCSYPALRVSNYFPKEAVLDYALQANEDRAKSMLFRFNNEEMLIEHTREKIWFGWSWNYGRNQVYADWGQQMTITDGGWIIAFSGGGVVGLVVYLAMVVLCLLAVWKRIKRIRDSRQQVLLACLMLYLAIMWVDILPNGNFNLLAHFLGGALCSISRTLVAQSRKKARENKQKLKEQASPTAKAPSAPLAPVAVAPPAG